MGLGGSQSTEEFYGQCWRRDKIAIHSECFPRIKEQEENISVLVWEQNKQAVQASATGNPRAGV